MAEYNGEERRKELTEAKEEGGFETMVLLKLKRIEQEICGNGGEAGLKNRVSLLETFNIKMKTWVWAVIIIAGGTGGAVGDEVGGIIKKILTALLKLN